ncbi:MAG: energy-coupled thiamine transporter ThiT [Oscillospiraceae bacterium]|nr:energy-coupled thiamine transporter ThiT [Oscillospiraceae bacterium]
MLCEGALMIVLAQVLDFVPLWKMPWGGTISLNMVPMIFFACRWGLGAGLLSGAVFGVVQFMFNGGIALGWQSILGDYLVAYMALGLAGVFVGRRWSIYAGTAVGCAARFLVHYVVGATIWAENMPEVFFGLTMTSPWQYSLLYNGFYMGIDFVLCLAVFALLSAPLGRYFLGSDLK